MCMSRSPHLVHCILTHVRVQITLQHPNKTNVLSYLDGNATEPDRYARATIMFGATNSTDLYWQEYLVGPLPATNSTNIVPLTYPFNNQQPGKTSVHPIYSPSDIVSFQTMLSSEIEEITKELWNSVMPPSLHMMRANVSDYPRRGHRGTLWRSLLA
jgi:hypothetical protein